MHFHGHPLLGKYHIVSDTGSTSILRRKICDICAQLRLIETHVIKSHDTCHQVRGPCSVRLLFLTQ